LEFVQELKEGSHKDAVRSLAQVNENEMWSGGRELDGTICIWSYDLMKRNSATVNIQSSKTNLSTSPRNINNKNDNFQSNENRNVNVSPTISPSSIFAIQVSPRSNWDLRQSSYRNLTPRQTTASSPRASPLQSQLFSPREKSPQQEELKKKSAFNSDSEHKADTKAQTTTNQNNNSL
jgi:hypothetical protein